MALKSRLDERERKEEKDRQGSFDQSGADGGVSWSAPYVTGLTFGPGCMYSKILNLLPWRKRETCVDSRTHYIHASTTRHRRRIGMTHSAESKLVKGAGGIAAFVFPCHFYFPQPAGYCGWQVPTYLGIYLLGGVSLLRCPVKTGNRCPSVSWANTLCMN